MIHPIIEREIVTPLSKLMIPADNVAHVLGDNTLSHAMLVLSTVNYSLIPVLSTKSKLLGLINIPLIIKSITTLDAVDVSKLDTKFIRDVMIPVPAIVQQDEKFERILHLLVDHNFICVIDQHENFVGIITRREVLKRLNHLLHTISNPEQLNLLRLQIAHADSNFTGR